MQKLPEKGQHASAENHGAVDVMHMGERGFRHHIFNKLSELGQELLEVHEKHIRKIATRVLDRDIEIQLLQEKIKRLEAVELELLEKANGSFDLSTYGSGFASELSRAQHDGAAGHRPRGMASLGWGGSLRLEKLFPELSPRSSARSVVSAASTVSRKGKRKKPHVEDEEKTLIGSTLANLFGFLHLGSKEESDNHHHENHRNGQLLNHDGGNHQENLPAWNPVTHRTSGQSSTGGGALRVSEFGLADEADTAIVDLAGEDNAEAKDGVPVEKVLSGPKSVREKAAQMAHARQRAEHPELDAPIERHEVRQSVNTLAIPNKRTTCISNNKNCTKRGTVTENRGASKGTSADTRSASKGSSAGADGRASPGPPATRKILSISSHESYIDTCVSSPTSQGSLISAPAGPAPEVDTAAQPPSRSEPPPLVVEDHMSLGQDSGSPSAPEAKTRQTLSFSKDLADDRKSVGFKLAKDPGKGLDMMSRTSDDSAEDTAVFFAENENCFALLPTWFVDQQVTKISQTMTFSGYDVRTTLFDDDMSDSSETSSDDCMENTPLSIRLRTRARKCCAKCMIHPNAGVRMLWDMIATVLVCWECVVVPMAFLNLKGNSLLDFMEWFVRIFWTFDIIFAFLTGYIRKEGLAEMRPAVVCRKYLRTWFPLDLMMVSVDWSEVIAAAREEVGSLTAARMSKFLKSIRMIRMARLWRILRIKSLPNCMKNLLEYYFQSEVIGIVMAIVRILVLVLWINHVFACVWYGLGEGADDNDNWIYQHGYADKAKTYLYWTAFHWSLSQFTGNMEVFPWSMSERMFAVLSLVLIFVIGAASVSSITASITNLSIATALESKKLSILKQYLYEHRISSRIALRVQRNAQYVIAEQKRNTPEERIELFHLLSEPLRIELHFEIHMPMLASHPFFLNYLQVCPGFLRQVCHQSIFKHRLSKGDVLFSDGEVDNVPKMFFVAKGLLKYAHARSDCSFSLCPLQWVSEACLWTPWIHCGSMRARSECTLLALEADRVAQIAVQFHAHVSYAQRYGHGFVKHLNSQEYESLTDLEDDEMNILWLAEKSLPSKKELFSKAKSLSILSRSRKTRKSRVTDVLKRAATSLFRPSNGIRTSKASKRLSREVASSARSSAVLVNESTFSSEATSQRNSQLPNSPSILSAQVCAINKQRASAMSADPSLPSAVEDH